MQKGLEGSRELKGILETTSGYNLVVIVQKNGVIRAYPRRKSKTRPKRSNSNN